MRFETLRHAAVLGVAGVGFLALDLGEQLDGPLALTALGAWLAAWWRGRPRLPSGVWLGLQIAFLVWLAAAGLLGYHVLDLFAQLLVFVQVHRLLTRRRASDDRYVLFIAFGQVLLASVLTIHVGWFLIFVAFAVTSTWAMLLGRLAMVVESDWLDRHGTEHDRVVPEAAFQRVDGLVGPRFLAAITALTAGLLVGTLALFFVLPRMHLGLLGGGFGDALHVSGFDERVQLGEVGTMQLSDAPVMRVRVTDAEGRSYPAVPRLYWHGLALDRFDGRAWELSDKRRTTLYRRGSASEGPPRSTPWTLRQDITLEVLDTPVLFHVQRPAGIFGPFTSMEAVETEGYYAPAAKSRLDYTVYSAPPQVDPAALRDLDPRAGPADIRAINTQLPADLAPRVAELAREWTRGAASPVDEVLLIEQRLRGEEFTYSLDQPASVHRDPLLAFLDDVREGHCEYFASSLAVMLRTLGIPARVVNGFAGAEWNPVGEYWVVRRLHAHSWVEVHFGEAGWIPFDPTPSSAGAGSARLTLSGRVGAWADYAKVTWSGLLLDYEAGSQLEAIRSLARWMSGGDFKVPQLRGRAVRRPASAGSDAPRRDRVKIALVLLVSAVLAAGLAALHRRLRGSRGARRVPDAAARRAVQRLLKTWRRRARRGPGDDPGDGGTARAWAAWAATEDPDRWAPAPDLIDRYYRSRFGEQPVDVAALERLRRG